MDWFSENDSIQKNLSCSVELKNCSDVGFDNKIKDVQFLVFCLFIRKGLLLLSNSMLEFPKTKRQWGAINSAFFQLFCWSQEKRRSHTSSQRAGKKGTWAALQAELADRSGSCVGLSSAFECFDRRGKTRSFLHSPLNYVTVKTTFWRSELTTWIPPIKVNKNKAIEQDTLYL